MPPPCGRRQWHTQASGQGPALLAPSPEWASGYVGVGRSRAAECACSEEEGQVSKVPGLCAGRPASCGPDKGSPGLAFAPTCGPLNWSARGGLDPAGWELATATVLGAHGQSLSLEAFTEVMWASPRPSEGHQPPQWGRRGQRRQTHRPVLRSPSQAPGSSWGLLAAHGPASEPRAPAARTSGGSQHLGRTGGAWRLSPASPGLLCPPRPVALCVSTRFPLAECPGSHPLVLWGS